MELKTKYCPKNINDIIFNATIANKLYNILKNPDHSNIILYGQKSYGKNIVLNCCLNTIYKNHYPYIKTNVKNNIIYNYSNIHHHFYFNLKNKLDELIPILNDIINTKNHYIELPYNIIIFDNFHYVSDIIQNALRKIIENNYIKTIIITNKLSKIINPIKSRCNLFNIPNNHIELMNFVNHINKSENIIIDNDVIEKICHRSNINNVLEDLEIFYKTGQINENIYIEFHNNIISIVCKKKISISDIEQIKEISHNILIMNDDIINYLKDFLSHIINLTNVENNGNIAFKKKKLKKIILFIFKRYKKKSNNKTIL